jgi:hypothetical protein
MIGAEFKSTIDREVGLWADVAKQAKLKFE